MNRLRPVAFVAEVILVVLIGLPLAFVFIPWMFVNAAVVPWERGRRA